MVLIGLRPRYLDSSAIQSIQNLPALTLISFAFTCSSMAFATNNLFSWGKLRSSIDHKMNCFSSGIGVLFLKASWSFLRNLNATSVIQLCWVILNCKNSRWNTYFETAQSENSAFATTASENQLFKTFLAQMTLELAFSHGTINNASRFPSTVELWFRIALNVDI